MISFIQQIINNTTIKELGFGMAVLCVFAYLIAMMFAIIGHELAHGYVAYWNGDKTAKFMGRLSPNPVKHFVYTAVKEKLGVDENSMIVVENSSRYTIESLIPVILDFGTRSMQDSGVKFPYWENIGRGAEDVKALVLLWQGIFLLIPTVILVVFLFIKWKNRNFSWRDVGNYLIDTKEKLRQHAIAKKDKWKDF